MGTGSTKFRVSRSKSTLVPTNAFFLLELPLILVHAYLLAYDDSSGHFMEEQWFNTTDQIFRDGMAQRTLGANHMGCDAVDPHNANIYDNENGFNAKPEDAEKEKRAAIDYVSFLSNATHKASTQVNLKNPPEIVDRIIRMFDSQVNKNCANSTRCGKFRKFISDSGPVFEIVYPTYLGANSTVKGVNNAK